MPKFLQNSLNIRDAIYIGTLIVAMVMSHMVKVQQVALMEQRLTSLEEEGARRAIQGEKAIEVLNSLVVQTTSHVAAHKGLDP